LFLGLKLGEECVFELEFIRIWFFSMRDNWYGFLELKNWRNRGFHGWKWGKVAFLDWKSE
jgi:hypothetical protein